MDHTGRLISAQNAVRELLSLIAAEDQRRLARHVEEKQATEQLVASLQQSHDILNKEKKRLKADLQSALAQATAAKAKAQGPATAKAETDADVVDLQTKLIDLNNRLLDIDFELQKVSTELAECKRGDEQELLSTKMVVLQDTKRILTSEIDALRSNIFRIETTAQVEADKKSAEESGYAALGRVEEQMQKITTRMDRAKQTMYFPAAKGFRFSTGAGGVYMAAQDLFLSEISGRVTLTAEKVTRPDGVTAARFSVTVGGVSNTRDWTEGSSRRGSAPTPTTPSAPSVPVWADSSHRPAAPAPVPTVSTATPAPTVSAPGAETPLTGSHPAGTTTEEAASTADTTPAGLMSPPVPMSSTQAAGAVESGTSHIAEAAADLQSQGASPQSTPDMLAAAGDSLPPQADAPLLDLDLKGTADPQATGPSAAGLLAADPQITGPPAAAAQTTVPAAITEPLLSSDPLQTAAAIAVDAPVAGQAAPVPADDLPVLPELPPISTTAASSAPLGQRGSVGGASPSSRVASVVSTPTAASPMAEAGNTPKKGEMMSGFLSSISKRKDKLKDMIAGQHSSSSGIGPTPQGSGRRSEDSSSGVGGPGVPVGSGRLGQRMGKLREGLGTRMDKMKEGLGGKMDRVKEGLGDLKEGLGGKVDRMKEGLGDLKLGDKMEKVKGTLQEGLQDGKGKLSRLASAVTHPKPPLGRNVQGVTTDHLFESSSNRSSLDHTWQDASGTSRGQNQSSLATTSVASTGSGPTTPSVPSAHRTAPQVHLSATPSQPSTSAAPHLHRSSTDSALGATGSRQRSDNGLSVDVSAVGGSDGGGGAAGPGDASLSVAFEEFAQHQTRKGLYVQLLGEGVQLIGERGTKVPDMNIKEFMLEVEVALTAVIEWTALEGWQVSDTRPLDLSILQLDHKMRGNSIPLPRTALKTLLNLVLPGVVTRLLLSSLPPELGSYVVHSGEQLLVAGEFRVRGPALSTYTAPLHVPPLSKAAAMDPTKHTAWLQQAAAAARARQLLGLTEHQAQVLNELFSGPHALFDPPRPASLAELCRMLVSCGGSQLWSPLSNQWNKALQVLFEAHSVAQSERFNFLAFMDGPVARVLRKPVQVAFMMDQLQVQLDVDAALNAVHDLFVRLVKDLHARSAKGDQRVAVPTEPLDVQLDTLQLWHAALATQLRTFKSRFRVASCGVVVAADREVFQFGAENINYDGPMRLRVPLEVLLDADHAFVVDVKLPGRSTYMSSVKKVFEEILHGLSVVRGGTGGDDSQASSRPESTRGGDNSPRKAPGAGGSGQANGTGTPAEYLEKWQDMVEQTAADLLGSHGQPAADPARSRSQHSSAAGGLEVPLLDNPVIGQLTVRKVSLSLRLDEERMAELLQGGGGGGGGGGGSAPQYSGRTGLLGTLLGCYGELFSASLDVGWRPDLRPEAVDGATRPMCMLTVANNEVTRIMATLESLIFTSTVSPKIAVSVLATVINGIMLRFYSSGSYQVRFWQSLFRHLYEYLGRDALDALVCLSARLETVKGPLASKLRLTLQGDPRLAHGVAGGSAGGAGSQTPKSVSGGGGGGTGLLHAPLPVYLMNEVDLLTLLDSVKLLSGEGKEEKTR